jgi:hypothetical protein
MWSSREGGIMRGKGSRWLAGVALGCGALGLQAAPVHADTLLTVYTATWTGSTISTCATNTVAGTWTCHISADAVEDSCPYAVVTTYGCSVAFAVDVTGTWSPQAAGCGAEVGDAYGRGVIMLQEGPTWYGTAVNVTATASGFTGGYSFSDYQTSGKWSGSGTLDPCRPCTGYQDFHGSLQTDLWLNTYCIKELLTQCYKPPL